jgi:GT2 family glycosyltransferase
MQYEKICAVIPSYNCKEALAQCLEVVRRQTLPVDEIIVVDNASTDGTEEMIGEKFGASITYVRLPENVGGAGGFDLAMRLGHAHGHDWIWCLDSDALPTETTLHDLRAAHCPTARPIVAITCILYDPQTGQASGSATRRVGNRNIVLPPSVWEGKTIPVDNASLCCFLVRADAAERAGFIKKELFISADDYFLSRELSALGEIVQVGTVVVTHPTGPQVRFTMRRGHRRLPAEDYWRIYYRVRNALLFEKRYYNLRAALVRFITKYIRSVAIILLIDDYKFYRVGVLTRALVDGLLGRMGKRVDPREFRNRHKPVGESRKPFSRQARIPPAAPRDHENARSDPSPQLPFPSSLSPGEREEGKG